MSFKSSSLVSGYLCLVKLTAVLIVPTVIVLTSQISSGQQPMNASLVAAFNSEVKKPQGYQPPKRGVPSRREGAGTR